MTDRIIPLIDKLLLLHFLALATVTPIIFTTQTTELYEVPKMFLVYAISLMLIFLTLAKFILNGKILLPKNLVLTAFATFVAVQILSTFFSIDGYTSIFGFPTRLNGGLLSQFAYLAILATAAAGLSKDSARKILVAVVATAVFVSLWGIPGHFGYDPSCLVLVGHLTSDCWQADFNPQLRIFSTLGQPNWLASYLILTIPLALAYILIFTKIRPRLIFTFTSAILFTALVTTNSRAGALGIAVALIIFVLLLGKKTITSNLKILLLFFGLFIILTLIFGTSLISRTAQSVSTVPTQNVQGQAQTQTAQQAPTDSTKIRLIVWQGALQTFRRWPILGSGPETFVSSYFLERPASHNQTSEWAFYYNKAHNEFLNYLATTGAAGFLAYLAFISATVYTLVRSFGANSNGTDIILTKAVLAGFIGYLVSIFFGFSTVATQTTLFIMLPAAIVLGGKDKQDFYTLPLLGKKYQFPLLLLTGIIGLFLLSFILRALLADVFEKRAQSASGTKALVAWRNAVSTGPFKNPYLLSEAANTQALYLADLQTDQKLSQETDSLAQSAYDLSPNNYLVVQKVAKTYLLISSYSKDYQIKAEEYGNRLAELAPTYPDAWLTLAKIQIVLDKNDDAKNSLRKALGLKPDFVEAKELLDQLTIDR